MKKLILLCSFALLSFSCDKKADEKTTDKEACETDSKVNKDGFEMYEMSEINLKKGLEVAETYGLKTSRVDAHMHLSELYKKLNDYKLDELPKLERQLRAAESNYQASAEKPGNKAWYHKNKFPIPSKN